MNTMHFMNSEMAEVNFSCQSRGPLSLSGDYALEHCAPPTIGPNTGFTKGGDICGLIRKSVNRQIENWKLL